MADGNNHPIVIARSGAAKQSRTPASPASALLGLATKTRLRLSRLTKAAVAFSVCARDCFVSREDGIC